MAGDTPPNPLQKPGYRLDFHDEFEGPQLNEGKWLPYYLPQWSSHERSRPRYGVADGALTLRIEADQQPWCPEFDSAVKCSSVQTGLFAGPPGSSVGQHRFSDRLVVREAQRTIQAYVPQYGYFELRARAEIATNNLVALWMIGFEDEPDNSGEITIMEIFGHNVTPKGTRLGHGIKRINDPRLMQDFHEDLLPFDAADYHLFAAEWTPAGVDFYLDNRKLRTIGQSPSYPMQFMLNVYELPGADTTAGFTPSFTIDYFRAYQPVGGY